ncbi:MAG TPA: helix-turn-helix transcriptional regulator [Chitinophagales bacterium]|nr:helix-turn-helix transcriptional regulator [Chitinophagales bacterium]
MDDEKILAALGKNLKAMREKKKLSQSEAAEISGMKQGYISKLEAGEINITYTNLVAYCNALGITPIQVV